VLSSAHGYQPIEAPPAEAEGRNSSRSPIDAWMRRMCDLASQAVDINAAGALVGLAQLEVSLPVTVEELSTRRTGRSFSSNLPASLGRACGVELRFRHFRRRSDLVLSTSQYLRRRRRHRKAGPSR